MGKQLSIGIGAIVLVLGVILLFNWWGALVLVVKGTLPVLFIFGGAIAVIAGVSELKDTIKAKTSK